MIVITNGDLEKLKPMTRDSKGAYGKCFMYEDDKILKVFPYTRDFFCYRREIKRNIKNSLGINIDGVSFPIDIAKTEGFNFSYIMPYIEGISFNDLLDKVLNTDFNMTFEDFINLYHSAISKAYEIASYGIEMNDFHKNNCTINDDFTIGIFDVDFYKNKVLFNGVMEKYLRYYNMLEVNEAFFQMLVCIYNKKVKCCKSSEKNSELKKIDKIIDKFPKNKPGYVDSVLLKINDEFKKDNIKDLILR